MSFNGGRRRSDFVANEPFRERFLELKAQGVSTGEIARRLGWVTVRPWPDTKRVTRALGVTRSPHGGFQQCITRDMAARLVEVLDMDPHEADL